MKNRLTVENFVTAMSTFEPLELTTMSNLAKNESLKQLVLYLLKELLTDDVQVVEKQLFSHVTPLIKYVDSSYLQEDETFVQLEFKSLYPALICKAIVDDELRFNYSDFGKLYEFIVSNRYEIRDYALLHSLDSVHHNTKVLINVLYGLLQTKHDCWLVSTFSSHFIEYIMHKELKCSDAYRNHCIAADTDTFWFKNNEQSHAAIDDMLLGFRGIVDFEQSIVDIHDIFESSRKLNNAYLRTR